MLCRKLKSLKDISFMYDLFGKFQNIYGVSRNVWKYILKLWKKWYYWGFSLANYALVWLSKQVQLLWDYIWWVYNLITTTKWLETIYLKIYVLLKQTLPNITFTLTDITWFNYLSTNHKWGCLKKGWRKVKSETRRDAEILVRNPSPRLFGKKFRDSKKVKTNRAKTRLWDLSKTLPRFRDTAKIFWDPRFSRYHSPPLIKITWPNNLKNVLQDIFRSCKWQVLGLEKVQ